MSKKILITKAYDARKLGVSVGTVIDYDDAPEHLRKRHDDIHAPLGPETKARLEKESVRYPISLWYCKRMRPSRESLEKLNIATRSPAFACESPSSTSEPPDGSRTD